MWLASVASRLCWTCRFELSDRGIATLCLGCKVSIFLFLVVGIIILGCLVMLT
jgi:hypothetical protein